tara:strand:+ start:8142 stop:9167 length:1026 start_codon:yes stop_codon:yes gene_type:complete
MEFKDYYQTLGVKKTASADEIKTAYRGLARKYHPDINRNNKLAEAKFKEINEANEVIGDADNRRKYDQLGQNWRHYDQASTGTSNPFNGVNFTDASDFRWNVDLGGGPGGRSLSEDEVRQIFGERSFSDFFSTFFSGNAAADRQHSRPQRQHLKQVVELNLEEAYRGGQKRFSIRSDTTTPPRTLDVRIPAGVAEGSTIRVTGEGLASATGEPPGDLYLTVKLRPHSVFECKGRDLHMSYSLSIPTAVLGGEITIRTLSEDSVRLKIPRGTQSGQLFRVKGQGMPRLGRRISEGDLYVSIKLVVPKNLNEEEEEHYRALSSLETEPSARVDRNTDTKNEDG